MPSKYSLLPVILTLMLAAAWPNRASGSEHRSDGAKLAAIAERACWKNGASMAALDAADGWRRVSLNDVPEPLRSESNVFRAGKHKARWWTDGSRTRFVVKEVSPFSGGDRCVFVTTESVDMSAVAEGISTWIEVDRPLGPALYDRPSDADAWTFSTRRRYPGPTVLLYKRNGSGAVIEVNTPDESFSETIRGLIPRSRK